jgi:hypothetical protein
MPSDLAVLARKVASWPRSLGFGSLWLDMVRTSDRNGVQSTGPTPPGAPHAKRRAGPARILPGAWPPYGYQAAGPAPRTTVAVWDWPDWSVQLMLILSPGW